MTKQKGTNEMEALPIKRSKGTFQVKGKKVAKTLRNQPSAKSEEENWKRDCHAELGGKRQ